MITILGQQKKEKNYGTEIVIFLSHVVLVVHLPNLVDFDILLCNAEE